MSAIRNTHLLSVRTCCIIWITVVLLSKTFFSVIDCVYAENKSLPEQVLIVKSEKQMIEELIKGMRNHQHDFSFYYPGIAADFKKYRRESKAYISFFDKLAKKDGYMVAIISGSCITICGYKEQYVNFQFYYLTTKKQERLIDRKVKRIVNQIGKVSKEKKIQKAHDYLIDYMQYDEEYYSPYDAFAKGRGMCISYAMAFQRIMQEMRIPCIYIKGENHAWNMVKLGKYWYNVDVTWDDRRYNRYLYFLKADADFKGHKRPDSRWFHSLKMAKHSYNLNKIK